MKIGITCYPTYGGSGVVATELGLELAQRGHEIHFISYAQPIRLRGEEPNIHYHEVEVSRYPLFDYPPYDLALATRMAEVSQLYDLDLLHVHYAIPHSVSALLARQMLADGPRGRRLPFVTTLHGTDITLVGLDRSYFPSPAIPSTRATASPPSRTTSRSYAARFRREERDRSNLQLGELRCVLQMQELFRAARRVCSQRTSACWCISPISVR